MYVLTLYWVTRVCFTGLQELYFPTPGAREKLSRARISPTYHFLREHVNSVKTFPSKSNMTCSQNFKYIRKNIYLKQVANICHYDYK